MPARISLSDLVDAYLWASATGPYENAAYVTLASGRIWLVSDFDDAGEEPPEDVEDESLHARVPTQAELDLGRTLALRFAQERLPERHEEVRRIFAGAGAYGRFKSLLDAGGHLEAWYAYETQGVEHALRRWAARNGIELLESGAA